MAGQKKENEQKNDGGQTVAPEEVLFPESHLMQGQAKLAKKPMVKIKIKKKDDKDNEPVPVGINGYFYFIQKGEPVLVPEPVAELLEQADYI